MSWFAKSPVSESNLPYVSDTTALDGDDDTWNIKKQTMDGSRKRAFPDEKTSGPMKGSKMRLLPVKDGKKEKVKESIVDDIKVNEKIVYEIKKHVETNRDLFFVKLVAGGLKKDFLDMVKIENSEDQLSEVGLTIKTKYSYKDDLLTAQNTVVEKVQQMIDCNMLAEDKWNTFSTTHTTLIANDITCVPYAKYTSFILMTETNNLVPRQKTRFMIKDFNELENDIIISIMRAIQRLHGALRHDLRRLIGNMC